MPWTQAEIDAGKADCTKALAGLKLDYEPLAPIKLGICGAPAAIRVKSIGDNPKVVIDPPATMRCSLAAALSKWLTEIVQPEAKADLNAQVVKLKNASDYVCRNRYNAAVGILSEHALANALDISEFDFDSGKRVTVLDSWPKLLPKPTPLTASAKSPAHPSQSQVLNTPPSVPEASTRSNPFVADHTTRAVATPRTDAMSRMPTKVSARTNPFVARDGSAEQPDPPLPVRKPSALPNGAPPSASAGTPAAAPQAQSQAPSPPPDAEGTFLRHVHDVGCKDFGTVLGPEANAAHKSHFHLDMKSRRASYCE